MQSTVTRIQAAIGSVLLLAGCFWFWSHASLVLFGSQTEGTVTQNIPQGRGYAAEIVFHPTPDTTTQFTTLSSSNPPLYSPGDHVPVYFNAQHPERATTNSLLDGIFGPAMLASAGIVNIILAGIQYRKASRGIRPSRL